MQFTAPRFYLGNCDLRIGSARFGRLVAVEFRVGYSKALYNVQFKRRVDMTSTLISSAMRLNLIVRRTSHLYTILIRHSVAP